MAKVGDTTDSAVIWVPGEAHGVNNAGGTVATPVGDQGKVIPFTATVVPSTVTASGAGVAVNAVISGLKTIGFMATS